MILPNKFSNLDNSILAKIHLLILDDVFEIKMSELMQKRIKKFNDISEFIEALDVLYALGKIELDQEKKVIRYVG